MPTILVDGHHRALSRVVVDDVAGGQHRRDPSPWPRTSPAPHSSATTRTRGSSSRRADCVGSASPSALRSAGLELPPGVRPHRRLAARDGPTGRERAARAHTATDRDRMRQRHRGPRRAGGRQTRQYRRPGSPVGGWLRRHRDRRRPRAHHHPPAVVRSGRRGVALLLSAMEGAEGRPVRDVLPLELIVRATTGPASA